MISRPSEATPPSPALTTIDGAFLLQGDRPACQNGGYSPSVPACRRSQAQRMLVGISSGGMALTTSLLPSSQAVS